MAFCLLIALFPMTDLYIHVVRLIEWAKRIRLWKMKLDFGIVVSSRTTGSHLYKSMLRGNS